MLFDIYFWYEIINIAKSSDFLVFIELMATIFKKHEKFLYLQFCVIMLNVKINFFSIDQQLQTN